MSTYYSYYIGYKDEQGDNLIHPLGPFDADGKLHPAGEWSRSWCPGFRNMFYRSAANEYSGEFVDAIKTTYDSQDEEVFDNDGFTSEMDWIYLSELPSGDYIKSGYFLIDDVRNYLAVNNNDRVELLDELFFDKVTPVAYNGMCDSELKFGKKEPTKDELGFVIQHNNASDYMYFAYEDTNCDAYKAHVIKVVADVYESYKLPKGAKKVVIQTIG